MNATESNAAKVAKALTPAVDAYLLAKAHAELRREEMEPLYERIIAEGGYTDKDGQPVTRHDRAYNIEPDSEAQRFYAACDKAVRDAGYGFDKVPEGHCPALIAEHLVTKAVWLIIKTAEEFFPGVTNTTLLCAGLDEYERYIELVVKIVVNAPGYQTPLKQVWDAAAAHAEMA